MNPAQLQIAANAASMTQDEIRNRIKMIKSAVSVNRMDEKDAADKIAVWESFLSSVIEVEKVTNEQVARKYLNTLTSANSRGIECTLSFKHVRRLLERKTCFYTGVKLTAPSGDYTNSTDRTIDRIDSDKGYTDDNTVACSYAANSLKNEVFESKTTKNLSGKELQKFATKMVACGF